MYDVDVCDWAALMYNVDVFDWSRTEIIGVDGHVLGPGEERDQAQAPGSSCWPMHVDKQVTERLLIDVGEPKPRHLLIMRCLHADRSNR